MPDEIATPFKTKRVVAALLVRGNEILCCQRKADDPHPLKWEFPGGKIEADETPAAALARELDEELAIRAEIGEQVALITHSYVPGTVVELYFFRVDRWEGEIVNRIFNDVRWVRRGQMPTLDFLEADLGLVKEISAGGVL